MTDGIYLGMNGAAARLAQLDTIADNLANAETPGFRAGRPTFESFLPEGVTTNSPAYVAAMQVGADTRSGDVKHTGRQLDVRLDDNAWLVVQNGDGSLGYTKDGRLEVNRNGEMLVGGRPVLGANGSPIIVPVDAPARVDGLGQILVRDLPVDRLALSRLEGPLSRIAPTVVTAPQADLLVDSVERVHVGELEGSNARALDATVQLISAQRAYDHAMQAVQTYRKLDERGVEMGRLKG